MTKQCKPKTFSLSRRNYDRTFRWVNSSRHLCNFANIHFFFLQGESLTSSVFFPVSTNTLQPSKSKYPWSNQQHRTSLFHVNPNYGNQLFLCNIFVTKCYFVSLGFFPFLSCCLLFVKVNRNNKFIHDQYDPYTQILFSLQALRRGLKNRNTLISTQTFWLRSCMGRDTLFAIIDMSAFLEALETWLIKIVPLSETLCHSEKCFFFLTIIAG